MLTYVFIICSFSTLVVQGNLDNKQFKSLITCCEKYNLEMEKAENLSPKDHPKFFGCYFIEMGCITENGMDVVMLEKATGKPLDEEDKVKATNCFKTVPITDEDVGNRMLECQEKEREEHEKKQGH